MKVYVPDNFDVIYILYIVDIREDDSICLMIYSVTELEHISGTLADRWEHNQSAMQVYQRAPSILPKVCGHLTITSTCGPSLTLSTQLYRMYLYAIALQFLFTGTKKIKGV